MKKTEKRNELIRFLICGILATIIDYLASQFVIMVLPINLSSTLVTIISSTIGFLVSVIFNYVLSTYWVYQNVSKDVNTKTTKFKMLFIAFSVLALLVSLLVMTLCQKLCLSLFNIDIVSISVITLLQEGKLSIFINSLFWAYALSFLVKTISGLFVNYYTRKKFLYKESR